jgi:hypothetical protein
VGRGDPHSFLSVAENFTSVNLQNEESKIITSSVIKAGGGKTEKFPKQF